MGLEPMVAYVQQQLESLDIGPVHPYDRLFVPPAAQERVFGNPVRAWFIDLQASDTRYLTNRSLLTLYTLRLIGVREVNDALGSRVGLRQDIAAIRLLLDGDDTLGNTCELCQPLQVLQSGGLAEVGGILCHTCELHLVSQEQRTL
jgi:hypothetical protein